MIRYHFDEKSGRFFRTFDNPIVPDFCEDIGTFYDLMERIKGDFSLVDFGSFDFSTVDVKSLDLSNAIIPTDIQKRMGIFDYKEYNACLPDPKSEALETSRTSLATIERSGMQLETYDLRRGPDKSYRLFYITDLHLDQKIAQRFPEPVSGHDIDEYIDELLSVLVKDYFDTFHIGEDCYRNYLLIGGDVSDSVALTERFYSRLTCHFNNGNILSILGNHELWNTKSQRMERDPNRLLDSTIAEYTRLFKNLHLPFLHNVLYAPSDSSFVRGDEILRATDNEIREFCLGQPVLILGGIGFSGKSDVYNFDSGIYKNVLVSREQEIEQSELFESIYNRLLKVIPDLPLIVFTHMPMECWSEQLPHENWIYIHGHTHNNRMIEDNGAMIYGDNQIGYRNVPFHLKSIMLNYTSNVFKDLDDGVHEISREQYRNFYRQLEISINCNREGQYYLVKNKGLYCFFLRTKTGNLSILDGGMIKRVFYSDLNYYYENLVKYAEAVSEFVSDYRARLKEISKAVRAFGGYGSIHGSIVDITFFTHLFLNPFDGSVIPYYAQDMRRKRVYRDVGTLLKNNNRELMKSYNKINDDQKALIVSSSDDFGVGDFIDYEDTWMYRCSRVFRKMQYISEVNVIRIWNDNLLKDEASRKKMIFQILGIDGLLEGPHGH